jgi:transcriptional regulator GlxA family with amidase domain
MGRGSKHGIDRDDWERMATCYVKRGQELPQTKLLEMDVISIRSAARQRESLRQHIKNTLSNEALAKSFGVHVRTIERVLKDETWTHLP